jgi:CobQ-like glutamine amidotransferase family enzyme
MSDSPLRLVALFPELLGTYGDGGNLLVLQRRLLWRGLPCELTIVRLDEPVPATGDLYLLGGGEDDAQLIGLDQLRRSALRDAVLGGAHVFGVCAGLQLLGGSFVGADGTVHEGLGLLDLRSDRLDERAVGEAVVTPDPVLALPLLTGFENHRGRTVLGPGGRALGQVTQGIGNGDGGAEGAYDDRVLATYLHGPVLARNPALADLLLSRVLGHALEPLDDTEHDALRSSLLPLS